MRIIVLSDSHRDFYSLNKAIQSQPSAEIVVFCGDGVDDIETFERTCNDKMVVAVRGNCDFCTEKKYTYELCVEGKNIFVTHGHLFGVKSGYSQIIQQAKSMNVDILLFGHTHEAYTSYTDGMYIMNPGSIGYGGTYGIIDITPKGIVTNIIQL